MEKTISSEAAFRGKLLKLDVLDVELEDGTRSKREVILHPGAVAVLAHRPDNRFVFVRQFRKAIEQDLLEVVAGTLEVGEDPETCARRELAEESGYAARSITYLGRIAVAPGYSSECIHLYDAEVEEHPGSTDMDEDERIAVAYLSESEINAHILSGELQDAKTLACWALYQQKRSV